MKGIMVHLCTLFVTLLIPSSWGIMNSAKFDLPDNPQQSSIPNYNDVLENPLANYHPNNYQISQASFHNPHDPEYAGNRGEIHGTNAVSNGIQIEMSSTTNLTGSSGLLYFVIKNPGLEDEYVHINVSDEKGYAQGIPPTEFYLPSGSSQEISVRMNYPPNVKPGSPDMITVKASGKRNAVKRSAYYAYPGNDYEYGHQQYQPFCYDRYVTGSCRYRMDPYYCDSYKWTAYATIQSPGGIQQLRSIPEGLFVPPEFYPGTRDRIRVYLTVSCCIPVVQFININPFYPNSGNACIVDVRELQWLNPAEIAGIVIGVIALIVIIIVVVALIIRRRRNRTVLVGQTAPQTTRETTSRE